MDFEQGFISFINKLPKRDSFSFILRFILNYSGCKVGGIRILDEKGFIPYEHFVGFSEEFWQSENWLSVHNDNCICIRVIRGSFEPQDLKCITEYGTFYTNNSEDFVKGLSEWEKARFRGQCIKCGFKSVAVIPLYDDRQLIGAIHLADYSENMVKLEKILDVEKIAPLIVAMIKEASWMAFQAAIVQQLKQSVIVVDKKQNILFWNDRSSHLLGWTAEEVVGQGLADIGLETDLAVMFNKSAAKDFWSQEMSFSKRNGEKIWVQISLSRLIDSHGYLMGFILICHDITRQKIAQRDMQRLEQLHLVGQVAAGMGHEIRNCMTTVRGFLQLFSGKAKQTMEKEYYELMINELDRANSIITDFLSLAKDRVINMRREDLNTIIKSVSQLLQANAIKTDKEIVLELQEIPSISLDINEIKKLILNLAQNGLEAMMPGGALYIKTFLSEKEVVLEVKDMGSGIPPEIIDKIGQPFTTTKETGIGLGLSECYSICAKHGAKIDFATGKEGTVFLVRFPI